VEREGTKGGERRNALASEKSPYLLQHAGNPVDWYPWGAEAFDKARREDKPLFLSIGYSTCHWCHVMAHESFEDPEIALMMNDAFVNVKVDREERPDIDDVYMEVCQAMTGLRGWPLSIVITPDASHSSRPRTSQRRRDSGEQGCGSLYRAYRRRGAARGPRSTPLRQRSFPCSVRHRPRPRSKISTPQRFR